MNNSFLILLFISIGAFSGIANSKQSTQAEVATNKAAADAGPFERGLICKALYNNEIRDYISLSVKTKAVNLTDEQTAQALWSVACQKEASFSVINKKGCYKNSNQCIGLSVSAKNGGTVRCKVALFAQAAAHTPNVGLNCLVDASTNNDY